MKILHKILLLLAFLCTASQGYAQLVKDGLAYEIISVADRTCAVVQKHDLTITGHVVIPAQVELNGIMFDVVRINGYAFYLQEGVTAIEIPQSVTYIDSWAFGYTGISEIVIPNSVTHLGYCALAHCPKLARVLLSDNMTELEFSLFDSDSELKSITIPPGIAKIGDSAFTGTGLTEIHIPATVGLLGGRIFGGCKNLTKIYCESIYPPNAGSGTFNDFDVQACTLYVPVGAKAHYENDPAWFYFYGRIIESEEAGIDNIALDAATMVDIYSLDGIHIYSGSFDARPATLKGIYIVKSAKVVTKTYIN